MRHVCKEFALCLAGLGKFGIKPFKLGSVLLFRRDGAIFLNLQNDVYHNRRDHKHNNGKYQHKDGVGIGRVISLKLGLGLVKRMVL